MKKIAKIYDFLKEMGGLERVMFFQANSLLKKGEPFLVFSYIDKNNVNNIIKELELNKKVRIIDLHKGKSEFLSLLKSLLFPYKIKRIDADLIISHSFMSSRIAYSQKKKYKT